MNKLYYLLTVFLILIVILLSKSIFFGENSYSKRAELVEDNKIQEIKNEELKRQNKIPKNINIFWKTENITAP